MHYRKQRYMSGLRSLKQAGPVADETQQRLAPISPQYIHEILVQFSARWVPTTEEHKRRRMELPNVTEPLQQ